MKLAAMAYHSDAASRYACEWIEQCVLSMAQQTDRDFDLHELNYGDSAGFYFPYAETQHTVPLKDYAQAMNLMLTSLFEYGYDAVLNINIDDYYAPNRVALQRAALEEGYDIVSGNFIGIDLNGEVWLRTKPKQFHTRDIAEELTRGHNIIAHGAVAYSRKFWNTASRYRSRDIPNEDLRLWQREIKRQRFIVLPENLMVYRKHPMSVSQR